MCCTCELYRAGVPHRAEASDPQCPVHSEIKACSICGRLGPCGTDADGRPMVHTDVFPEVS